MEKKSSSPKDNSEASQNTDTPKTTSETTTSTSQPSSNNNWLYILGGCCCLLILGLIIAGVIFIFYFSTSQIKNSTSNLSSQGWDDFESSIDNSLDNLDSDFNNYYDQYKNDLSSSYSKTGTIEGSLSYPGEKIPSDLKVCAENIFYSEQTYCADKLINDPKYTNSTGYTINAPVGSYYVYSYLPSEPDKKAYYTEFVDCGMTTDCTSHDELIIDVYPGETTDYVDPVDWYNQ